MDPNLHLNATAGTSGVPNSGANASSKTSSSGGPAFHALLEKLEGHTRDLRSASENLEGPGGLAGAVDRSRASIEDALSLHDQLLEAYRAANQNPDSTSEAA
tara:strand:- start:9789 stop:10094 length:306 start_codon:yes stop_codon:yes gene_type:complete